MLGLLANWLPIVNNHGLEKDSSKNKTMQKCFSFKAAYTLFATGANKDSQKHYDISFVCLPYSTKQEVYSRFICAFYNICFQFYKGGNIRTEHTVSRDENSQLRMAKRYQATELSDNYQ